MGSIGPTKHQPTAEQELDFEDLPPFPDDVPTVPLLRLNLKSIQEGNLEEIERLWKACCEFGFFYLDLRGKEGEEEEEGDALLKSADELFQLADRVFELPVEEKQKYDFVEQGSYFGYKGYGKGVVDQEGLLKAPLPNPPILQKAETRAKLKTYILHSHALVTLLLHRLNDKLGLPPETLPNIHRLDNPSGDQVRWVRSPPQPPGDRAAALGGHTDFGSVTILFNRLGGLQVLLPHPQQEIWAYVKPLRGHCVVNLGDAMVKFTRGILRSNLHRVVNPPGEQGGEVRLSLVYFNRPGDEVLLRGLEGSAMIEEAKERQGDGEEEGITAKQWILNRAMGRRVGRDWKMGEGTDRESRPQYLDVPTKRREASQSGTALTAPADHSHA
ncbi:1-aminocyclopropane-1-carboxylate oxidase [Lecanosticta acicola]|uniref:1-aminocyclopropane-1-carboxylate oxidase n=1 Tax=Lecanosticta acicola TaxID=111012 RepID=A0AAI9EBN2_9PEZI|nr:1-aminocyclopropane-1-carboxylate oxidase [Lecanosticta acicola]